MSLTTISVILLWIAVLVLAVLVILLYRQFGLLYLGSSGRVALSGLEVRSPAPPDLLLEVQGQEVALDWGAVGPGRASLLVFGAPVCPLCEKLLPRLNEFAEGWGHAVDVWFVDRELPNVIGYGRDLPKDMLWRYGISRDGSAHQAFDVEVHPFAFVVLADGSIASKGVVNTPNDLVRVAERGLGIDRLDAAGASLASSPRERKVSDG